MDFIVIALLFLGSVQMGYAQWSAPAGSSLYIRNNTDVDMSIVSIQRDGNDRAAVNVDIPKGQITEVLHLNGNELGARNIFNLSIQEKKSPSKTFSLILMVHGNSHTYQKLLVIFL